MGLNMLGNFSTTPSVNGGNAQLNSMNQGLTVGGNLSLHGQGSHTLGSNSGHAGSPSLHRNLSVGAEPLAFTGTGSMVLPASPLSYSSSSLSGTAGVVSQSLTRQGSANRLDQQDPQQLQQQANAANSQFSHDAQLAQQQLEQHTQVQDLGTSQPGQGQQMGLQHPRNQQGFGLGTQQQLVVMDGLASVKVEQQQMSQQVQPMQGLGSVKLEQQMDAPVRQQSLQSVQGLTSVKSEQIDLRQQLQLQQQQQQHQQQQQRVQAFQGILPMKLDSRQHEQQLHQQLSLPKVEMKAETELPQQMVQQSVLTSHLQRQEALQLHRQQSQHFQAQMNLLQQQRLLHQHRTQLQQQQLQQHLQQIAGPSKQLVFEPGICARRLMQYMYNQRQRPQDNNIQFWRRFVQEFFAPRAKKRWCVSQYGNSGRQPTGVFPQDVWHCEICGSRPGRGFETTVEVLPRLCKIKYDSGILDELLYVDVSHEYRLNSGHMVLEYDKAIQESIFDQLRVVRDGQLKIIFSPDLKILSWQFCARGHEELLPRRLLVPQVTQLATIAQKYQNLVNQNQNGTSSLSMQDLQTNCQLFVGAARQLARTLEAPTVNDLGYTKRYVRCLQISEVVSSMKDLIDFSRDRGMGPIDSLKNFPRRSVFGAPSSQALQQPEHTGLQGVPTDQGINQTNKTMPISTDNSMNSSVDDISQTTTVMGVFPGLKQNVLTSLQNSLPSNSSSSFLTDVNTSTAQGPTSLLSSQGGASVSSLQNCHPLVGGQPSPMSAHSHPVQQNSLGSAVNLLQQSVSQGQETSNVMHHLLQEMMLPSQLRNGAPFQQAYGSGNTLGSTGLSGGIACGAGNMMKNVNGSGVCINNGTTVPNGGSSSIISNAMCNNDAGTLGGMSSSFSNSMVNQLSSSDNGSNVRSFGSNVSVNNMETLNAGRQNLSVLSQEQNLSLEDPSQSLLNDFANDDILSGLGNSSFTGLAFNWKSP